MTELAAETFKQDADFTQKHTAAIAAEELIGSVEEDGSHHDISVQTLSHMPQAVL